MDDLQLLQGEWAVVSHQAFGETRFADSSPPGPPSLGLRLVGHSYAQTRGESINEGVYSIDPAANPKHFDLFLTDAPGGQSIPGIYRLDGDQLTVCLGLVRPDDFTSPAEVARGLWVYRRVVTAGR